MGNLFFAAMGMCGTIFPWWWRGPRKPDPEPWWKVVVVIVIGLGVGVVSGTLFNDAVVNDPIFAGQGMIASGLFSFAASTVVTSIASMGMNTAKQ